MKRWKPGRQQTPCSQGSPQASIQSASLGPSDECNRSRCPPVKSRVQYSTEHNKMHFGVVATLNKLKFVTTGTHNKGDIPSAVDCDGPRAEKHSVRPYPIGEARHATRHSGIDDKYVRIRHPTRECRYRPRGEVVLANQVVAIVALQEQAKMQVNACLATFNVQR